MFYRNFGRIWRDKQNIVISCHFPSSGMQTFWVICRDSTMRSLQLMVCKRTFSQVAISHLGKTSIHTKTKKNLLGDFVGSKRTIFSCITLYVSHVYLKSRSFLHALLAHLPMAAMAPRITPPNYELVNPNIFAHETHGYNEN